MMFVIKSKIEAHLEAKPVNLLSSQVGMWTLRFAQWVERLLCTPGELSSDPRTFVKAGIRARVFVILTLLLRSRWGSRWAGELLESRRITSVKYTVLGKKKIVS